jgi:hypothetical protein
MGSARISKIVFLLISIWMGSLIPWAEAKAAPSEPCLLGILAGIQKNQLLEDLRTGKEILGDRRYLDVVGETGEVFHVKVTGYLMLNGKKYPKVLVPDGYAAKLDLRTLKWIEFSPESKAIWNKIEARMEEALKKKTLTEGDLQYLTVDLPRREGVYQVRVVGFAKRKGKPVPIVLHGEGDMRFLYPSELKNAFSSPDSKRFWLASSHDDGADLVEKHVHELPMSHQRLVERTRGINPNETTDLKHAKIIQIDRKVTTTTPGPDFEAFVVDESLGQGRFQKLGASIKKKTGISLVWAPDANQSIRGFFSKNAKVTDEAGVVYEPARIINSSESITSGFISDTEIHEIGHAQTHRRLMDGIPDPLGVQYRALPKKRLKTGKDYQINRDPTFYQDFSSADESRQHAYNFYNSVHQRKSSEVITDFEKKGTLTAHQAFGVNLKNFHEAMDMAELRLEAVKIFNLRHRELAKAAQAQLETSFDLRSIMTSKYDFLFKNDHENAILGMKTPESLVYIPVVGKAYDEILAPITSASKRGVFMDFGKNVNAIPDLKDYAHRYLENQIKMLDEQEKAIETSEKILTELQANPNQDLTLDLYLDIQNFFTRVKSSVNYSPKKLGELQSLVNGLPN